MVETSMSVFITNVEGSFSLIATASSSPERISFPNPPSISEIIWINPRSPISLTVFATTFTQLIYYYGNTCRKKQRQIFYELKNDLKNGRVRIIPILNLPSWLRGIAIDSYSFDS